ncbi:MAG: type III-B CRISPR module RAMP protein Cmr4 [Desulfovibrio sp.]|nr:type III-B CRISPR module RAMP protein Cmr4 [Desulfovibrio sp.]
MSTYLALTLDPLHVGAGGYRLGRVDNTIVRDAGSGLPKVPGSSLAGVVRCYASWNLPEGQKACDKGDCGQCPICTLFGYAATTANGKSAIGLLRFYDGHILAFPVRSMAGPVWVTCPSVMAQNGFPLDEVPGKEELLVNFDVAKPKGVQQARLNLGWLYLPCRTLKNPNLALPLGSADKLVNQLAIAPDWLFSEIVNSNLEVRTSVRIDPTTGAASSGALFTYEAIPSATLLAFHIAIDTYRCRGDISVDGIKALLGKSLAACASLGMGGMNTRGFGRVRFLTQPKGE